MIKDDKYYLNQCDLIGEKSRCNNRKSGAILVKDGEILCRGFNGPARGIPDCSERYKDDKVLLDIIKKHKIDITKLKETFIIHKCPNKVLNFYLEEGVEICSSLHSEKSCLLEAARKGISTMDTVLYCGSLTSPCSTCFLSCIQAGVKEIVVLNLSIKDEILAWFLDHSGIKIREFKL